jgi:hypothetical protein
MWKAVWILFLCSCPVILIECSVLTWNDVFRKQLRDSRHLSLTVAVLLICLSAIAFFIAAIINHNGLWVNYFVGFLGLLCLCTATSPHIAQSDNFKNSQAVKILLGIEMLMVAHLIQMSSE